MIIKENTSSPFMGNYFCIIEKYKLAFVVISKNAVTTLKNIAIYNKFGFVPEEEMYSHSIIGYSEESDFLYSKHNLSALENEKGTFIKFAVWRDPLERLISCYKFFCLECHERTYFRYLDLYHDNSFDRFMQFVEFELSKKEPLFQDEHIRKQSDYYEPSDVDFIVPINKLKLFLQQYSIPYVDQKFNETKITFKFDEDKWGPKIHDLYSNDYNIISNF